MRTATFTVPRYEPLQPWANRILWIDLSNTSARAEPSSPYMPEFLGSRGLAARLCWREYPEPVPAFSPENPLMVVPGALTGSRAPYAGRTTIHAFSPQAWPHEWFTRSSIGGHFGGELKRAGYDALVVTGACDTPVRIQIHDDQVRVLPADDLWGLDVYDALDALDAAEGRGAYHLTIGTAGERLSRIATIQSASSTAAGQGGFGAVMGSKQLKAISVHGTGRVELADPDRMTALSRAMARTCNWCASPPERMDQINRELASKGGGTVQQVACTEACPTPCALSYRDMPGVSQKGSHTGSWFCVAKVLLEGRGEPGSAVHDIYDWELSAHAAHEVNVLTNRYGLNQFDLYVGMVPWLIACQKAGLLAKVDGQAIDWRSPEFWAHALSAIAERRGEGDALAEGGWRGALRLGVGRDLAATRYPAWGHAGHWDGHEGHPNPFFPYTVVPAIQWITGTRDPFDSGHASLAPSLIASGLGGEDGQATVESLRAFSRALYGDADTLDPLRGYYDKGQVAHYHMLRAVALDGTPGDNLAECVTWDADEPDLVRRLCDVDGLGDVPLMDSEYHRLVAGIGSDWSREQHKRALQRIVTLERALQVRHWGRDRGLDESALPYFEHLEKGANPLIGERVGLDREQFAPVLTEFYALNGWDANGQPTRARMSELSMAQLYDEMVAGGEEKTAAA